MADQSKSYHLKLMADLKDISEARAYMAAALVEDDDVFLSVAKDIAEAHAHAAAAQSDAPSAPHSAEAFFRENGMECVPERTLVICERYAALRTAQLERELVETRERQDAWHRAALKNAEIAETAETALATARQRIDAEWESNIHQQLDTFNVPRRSEVLGTWSIGKRFNWLRDRQDSK